MKVVILAGGFGTRLSEKTERIPKPLVDVGDRPILWHIMKSYAHYGHKDFIICLGYKGYMIKEWFSHYFIHNSDITIDLKTNNVKVHNCHEDDWKVSLIDTGLYTGTGGRLKRIREYLDEKEPFLATYGDGVSNVNINELIRFHKNQQKLITLTAVKPKGRYGLLKLQGEEVKNFAEKNDNVDKYVNGGFFVIEPSALDYVVEDKQMWEQEPLQNASKDGEVVAFKHEGFWKAMDKLSEKKELDKLWKSKDPPWKVW
jgi:glucose-1-phosphate cytidylyltransferase